MSDQVNSGLLVVGADSVIGRALVDQALRDGLAVTGTTRRGSSSARASVRLNLLDSLEKWEPPEGIGSAILCAGVTSLEACRRDPVATRQINVTQTVRLARHLADAGVFVTFLSTNLVFDGARPHEAADAPTAPRTEYGRQKVAVEEALGEVADAGHAIVRMTKVVHPEWPLLTAWVDQLREGAEVRAFQDMPCSPIPLPMVVRGLIRIARDRRPGVWQFSADSDVTYAEIARHVAARMGREGLVREVSYRSAGDVEHVPAHTTLDAARAREELGLTFPPPLAAIDAVLPAV